MGDIVDILFGDGGGTLVFGELGGYGLAYPADVFIVEHDGLFGVGLGELGGYCGAYDARALLVDDYVAVGCGLLLYAVADGRAYLAQTLFVYDYIVIGVLLSVHEAADYARGDGLAVDLGGGNGLSDLFGDLVGVDIGQIVGEHGGRLFGEGVLVDLTDVELFGYDAGDLLAVDVVGGDCGNQPFGHGRGDGVVIELAFDGLGERIATVLVDHYVELFGSYGAHLLGDAVGNFVVIHVDYHLGGYGVGESLLVDGGGELFALENFANLVGNGLLVDDGGGQLAFEKFAHLLGDGLLVDDVGGQLAFESLAHLVGHGLLVERAVDYLFGHLGGYVVGRYDLLCGEVFGQLLCEGVVVELLYNGLGYVQAPGHAVGQSLVIGNCGLGCGNGHLVGQLFRQGVVVEIFDYGLGDIHIFDDFGAQLVVVDRGAHLGKLRSQLFGEDVVVEIFDESLRDVHVLDDFGAQLVVVDGKLVRGDALGDLGGEIIVVYLGGGQGELFGHLGGELVVVYLYLGSGELLCGVAVHALYLRGEIAQLLDEFLFDGLDFEHDGLSVHVPVDGGVDDFLHLLIELFALSGEGVVARGGRLFLRGEPGHLLVDGIVYLRDPCHMSADRVGLLGDLRHDGLVLPGQLFDQRVKRSVLLSHLIDLG